MAPNCEVKGLKCKFTDCTTGFSLCFSVVICPICVGVCGGIQAHLSSEKIHSKYSEHIYSSRGTFICFDCHNF